jgi:hypothetical protein
VAGATLFVGLVAQEGCFAGCFWVPYTLHLGYDAGKRVILVVARARGQAQGRCGGCRAGAPAAPFPQPPPDRRLEFTGCL